MKAVKTGTFFVHTTDTTTTYITCPSYNTWHWLMNSTRLYLLPSLKGSCYLWIALGQTVEGDERGVPPCTAPVPWAPGDKKAGRVESDLMLLPSPEQDLSRFFVALGVFPTPLCLISTPSCVVRSASNCVCMVSISLLFF
jgi:hypothetical protein